MIRPLFFLPSCDCPPPSLSQVLSVRMNPINGNAPTLVAAVHFLKHNDQRRLEPVRIIKSLAFQLAKR